MKQKRNPAHCIFHIPHNHVCFSALCVQTVILVIALPAHKCLNTSCCAMNEYGIGVLFHYRFSPLKIKHVQVILDALAECHSVCVSLSQSHSLVWVSPPSTWRGSCSASQMWVAGAAGASVPWCCPSTVPWWSHCHAPATTNTTGKVIHCNSYMHYTHYLFSVYCICACFSTLSLITHHVWWWRYLPNAWSPSHVLHRGMM